MLELRPYQQQAANQIRTSYRAGNRAPMLVLSTGGGKTVVFSYISHGAASKNKRVLILVHRIELIRQTFRKLTDFGVHCGIINAKYTPDYYAPVQVASVQTLVKRLDKIAMNFDLIIIDECHHATASTYRKIIDANPNAKLLGVTATPVRGDGMGLGVSAGGYFDDMILGTDISELIELGYLVKPKVFGPKHRIDFSDVEFARGDYDQKQIAKKVDKPTITGSAVAEYTKLCPGEPCVVFCVSIDHAKHVAEEFCAAGYRSIHADGSLDDDERKRRLDGLENGSVQVLTTCDLISEGTDIPAIACAILLRPTASEGLYLQQVGRALRPSPGKQYAIILDHVGNSLVHGLPDSFRAWSLDGSKTTRRSVAEKTETLNIKQCPVCYSVHEIAPICPDCGYVYAPKANAIKQVDGELAEITESDIEASKRLARTRINMARSLDDLKAIEAEMGYKRGWAEHRHRARLAKQDYI